MGSSVESVGERTAWAYSLAPPVRPEKFFRTLGEHPADFAALAFPAGDLHRVVGLRLGLDRHGAGVFSGRGLRLWQLAQRYRLPLITVFGR